MGVHKLIETPELLWELFEGYKKTIRDNTEWKKLQYVGKDGERKTDPLRVPLTMEGFENYVANIDNMPLALDHYFGNRDKSYEDFVSICSRIRREIRQDQIEGGMLGFYNPSITQRLNGLTDKSHVTVDKEQPLFE